MESKNNDNINQSNQTNNEKDIANNTDIEIKNDFFFIPTIHMQSTDQFDEEIGDQQQLEFDFDWLYANTYENNPGVQWRSTPIPNKNNKICQPINNNNETNSEKSTTSSISFEDHEHNM